MEIFNQYVLPPTREHLELLRYLMVLGYLVLLPYVGIVIGSALLSFFLCVGERDTSNPLYSRVAKELIDMAMPSRVAVLVFGILPLPVIWIIHGQWLIHSIANTMHLLPLGAVLVAAGLVVLMAYRHSLDGEGQNSITVIGTCGIGLAILLLGSFVLLGSVTRFFDPERWITTHHAVRLLTSWNVIWRYLYFLAGALSITGGAIIFFFFTWPGRAKRLSEEEARLTKYLGAGIAIAGMVLFPVFGFFYLFTLPIVALSGQLYWVGALGVGVLFIAFLYVYRVLVGPKVRFGAPTFVLFVFVFLLMIVGDQLVLVNATEEHIAALVTEAEEREAEIQLEREAMRSAAIKPDIVRGQEVFNSVCSTCHRMEERLVGPPLGSVLPKYAGNMDGLVSFIQKPSKVNPDYPPMPAPGLPLVDIKSVAAYLLNQITPDSKNAQGGAPEPVDLERATDEGEAGPTQGELVEEEREDTDQREGE
ncbi:MAG: c-type cytochrome [Candidatus Latescibacterota bacterium]|nr:MAG: c-type cytochrome [Candidatus Latescibacterota bacterium]